MSEIDTFYTKSINALHSNDHLYGKPALQTLLEEAIKSKTGQERNLNALVQSLMKQSGLEVIVKSSIEEPKASASSNSDHELDLDLLLKEDLACVICQGMDVGARNRLLECTDCHSLYHQECHQPVVSQQDADSSWICASCKEGKRAKKSPTQSSSAPLISKPKSTSSERMATSSSSSSYKSSSFSSKSASSSSSSKSMSGSSSKSSSGTKPASNATSSKHTPVTTTSNIISADKRIQNMKKKAAKLHEKKKISR